jgi:hypothetical protein
VQTEILLHRKNEHGVNNGKTINKYTPNTNPLPLMSEYTYEIAALNINGISAPTRINMLEDFLHSNETDLICLQEVMNSNINMIRNYSACISIGSENRVTAILIKGC